MTTWMIAALAAATYCIVRGVADLRRRRYVWGVLGIASGALLLLIPEPTHAVRIDLPGPAVPANGTAP